MNSKNSQHRLEFVIVTNTYASICVGFSKEKKNSRDYSLLFPRDLDARAKNECYRATFRLPKDECLDGHTDCTLWTPFNKMHIPGQMFVSNNYICFASKAEEACHLIIPLREVGISQLCITTAFSYLCLLLAFVSCFADNGESARSKCLLPLSLSSR